MNMAKSNNSGPRLTFRKGTVSKGELKQIRVEPRAKEVCDRLAKATGHSKGDIATTIILWAEDKIEIVE